MVNEVPDVRVEGAVVLELEIGQTGRLHQILCERAGLGDGLFQTAHLWKRDGQGQI